MQAAVLALFFGRTRHLGRRPDCFQLHGAGHQSKQNLVGAGVTTSNRSRESEHPMNCSLNKAQPSGCYQRRESFRSRERRVTHCRGSLLMSPRHELAARGLGALRTPVDWSGPPGRIHSPCEKRTCIRARWSAQRAPQMSRRHGFRGSSALTSSRSRGATRRQLCSREELC
jgi:hypothetical protein